MRPEARSRRLFGITRSKGKMYEFGVPLESHIAVPEGSSPEDVFPLSVATLGDAAAEVCNSEGLEHQFTTAIAEDLRFSASFFDAFCAARFSPELDRDVALLASATYYLSGRPGSSLVVSRQIAGNDADSPFQMLVRWLLHASWEAPVPTLPQPFANSLQGLPELVAQHFRDGSAVNDILETCKSLRAFAYRNTTARDLFFVDLSCAVAKKRLQASSWLKLPATTGISRIDWSPVIVRRGFPKELWPSQLLLAKEDVFAGASALIQMPTSSGKTKSIEIIIRSSFRSSRATLAVVIAPFRALCHEITNSLRAAFRNDDVTINEVSDALQIDYLEIAVASDASKTVLVLSPEKFLYVLRQTPALVNRVGLIIYDEGHQFDSGSRGVVYELLLTEITKLLPVSAQTILISAVIRGSASLICSGVSCDSSSASSSAVSVSPI